MSWAWPSPRSSSTIPARPGPNTARAAHAPDTPSTYGDGLSFAQGWAKKPPLSSSNFTNIQETDEPYDAIDFDQGRVEVDKAVSFDFFVTDMTPKPEIFLLQAPVRSVACTWPPTGTARC
jgi:hypothetical protein